MIQRLDALVRAGRYANRTDAVRAALQSLMEAERRREVDQAIVEGYHRQPADPPDDFTRSLAERSVIQEPW